GRQQDASGAYDVRLDNLEQKFTEGQLWSVYRSQPGEFEDAWPFGNNDDEDENDAVIATQAGFWCGNNPCASIPDGENANFDFIYVKGISNEEETTDEHTSNLLTANRVGNGGDPLNPFDRFSRDIGPNSPLWNTTRQIGGDDAGNRGQGF